MRYCGSKRRFMKELKPILEEHLKNKKQLFIDAFGGGMNVVCEIDWSHKWAIELNKYVCDLWKHLQIYGANGILEKYASMTEGEYYSIKQDYINKCGVYPDWLIGFAGTCASYGGAWFGGYAHFNPKKNEDHIKEAFNGLRKQVNSFKHFEETKFFNCSYEMISPVTIPSKSVIYCDPPYESTKKYESDFNHAKFWDWVRKMSKAGHYVYVSEYTAPDDFKCIWEKKKKDGMATTKKGKKQNTKTEKLFVYNGK